MKKMLEMIGKNLSHKWSPEAIAFKERQLEAKLNYKRELLQLQREELHPNMEMQLVMQEREQNERARLHANLMLKLHER